MIIETRDLSVEEIREAAADYAGEYPDFKDALEMYGAVMTAQREALDKVVCRLEMTDEQKEWRLREGLPLLDPRDVEIDPALFREVLGRVAAAVAAGRPEGFAHVDELVSWEGLDEDRIGSTRDRVLADEELALTSGWDSEQDKKVARSILWESLAPFYRKCGSIHYDSKIEQAIWQRGFCPLCGSPPLIGKFRHEDGLWLLECSLCHSSWNVQRASCPYCDQRQGSLEYLYLDEDPRRRAQYCEGCRTYVKTIDFRETGSDGVLPFEDIVTVELDLASVREGLSPVARRQRR